jgi:hypothetical protein
MSYVRRRWQNGEEISADKLNNIEEGIAEAKRTNAAEGKSAYDFAKEAGYRGTEAEFAAKLAEPLPRITSYTALSQLGLSGAVDMALVLSALPADSVLVVSNDTALADHIATVPGTYGLIVIKKGNAAATAEWSQVGSDTSEYYKGSWTSASGWSGWHNDRQIVWGTAAVAEGSASPYPEGTLYVVI